MQRRFSRKKVPAKVEYGNPAARLPGCVNIIYCTITHSFVFRRAKLVKKMMSKMYFHGSEDATKNEKRCHYANMSFVESDI